jgi:hypothetical protein
VELDRVINFSFLVQRYSENHILNEFLNDKSLSGFLCLLRCGKSFVTAL